MSNQAASITVLEFPENVRKRKEMYLPNKDYMIFELIDNAIDEHNAGHCDGIAVAIIEDKVIVEDNGRGIPIIKHKDPKFKGLSEAEIAFTTLHAGGKFGTEDGYKTSTGGLHGVGASCVNALAQTLNLSIKTGGKKYRADFSKGVIVNKLRVVEDTGIAQDDTGTEVEFISDPEMWGDEQFDLKKIKKRIQQLAYLNPGLTLLLHVDSDDKEAKRVKFEEQYNYPGGLNDYVQKIISKKTAITDITGFKTVVDNIEIAFSLAYTGNYNEEVITFCNNISTDDGGDHLTGFKMGLSKAINQYAIEHKMIKEEERFESDDTREGITAVVSVKVIDPKFEGQAKSKIKMPEVRTAVRKIVEEYIYNYLDHNPNQAKVIIDKAGQASKARKAAAKAREASRAKHNVIEGGLPGKLAGCSETNPELCELYLVEGDSAAGSAKQGRDRKTQAILPVFGKILNVEKSRFDKVITNGKLGDIVRAMGCGISDDFKIEKLRYHKIILMADADVDGEHINILDMTFFYRYFKPLIDAGYLYLAVPPLYKVKKGKVITYLYSEESLLNMDTVGADVQRYKGLGEMNPDQLWETTMNPENRTLIQVTIEDAEWANETIQLCMGDDVQPRREFIIENALVANIDS